MRRLADGDIVNGQRDGNVLLRAVVSHGKGTRIGARFLSDGNVEREIDALIVPGRDGIFAVFHRLLDGQECIRVHSRDGAVALIKVGDLDVLFVVDENVFGGKRVSCAIGEIGNGDGVVPDILFCRQDELGTLVFPSAGIDGDRCIQTHVVVAVILILQDLFR